MINNLITILKQHDYKSLCESVACNEDGSMGCLGVACITCPFGDEHNMAKLIKQLKEVSDGQQHSN